MKLNILSLALFCLVIIGCTEKPQGNVNTPAGSAMIEADRAFIKSNGTDAAELKVFVMDETGKKHDVTAQSDIYMEGASAAMESNMFSSSVEGEYKFYAIYGMQITEKVIVTVLNQTPEIPADPKEESADFKHRILLVQHTGTYCPNCPRMMDVLKALKEDPEHNDLYNHVASHSYNQNGEGDAAYSEAAASLSRTVCSGSYPEVTFNVTNRYQLGYSLSEITSTIDQLVKSKADISASAAVEALGNRIFVRTEVKAGVANTDRIAVWLLEDNIYSRQEGASAAWHHTHENSLRLMAGETPTAQIYGERIGSLDVGEKYIYDVTLTAKAEWNIEECKVLIVVTTMDSEGNYDVANSTICKIGEVIPYEYN